ncbi:MAG: uroporphyrinogen-III C-methyltransferase, partial [Candidatus Hydrogenedentes bacterium]|nr:uroporphyrinogen-III C-methyltransferase [Candidatus Hydrogenedentota bacterium]
MSISSEIASSKGLVWLVGGGPGDPGLITVKGLRCIVEADCLVYDSLCNPVLLDHARPDAERIYVGKRAGRHAMPQEEINEVLRRKAQEGKRVCRLKGGDPFVFGRGGEEASHLHKHGVRFEIVPGVTSAIAVPAYAGIPVTHREMTTSLRIITGHEDPSKPSSGLDWAEIAASQATLVFLMGVQNLRHIAARLIEHGRSCDTPAAVIADGTLPTQRTVVATLETIASSVAEAGLTPPAVLVVGEVASLRGELNWFENKPLFGRTIVVTRARTQASELAAALESLGAEVISAPVIRTESLADSEPMRKAAREAGRADWIVFTSVNGVDAFLDALINENMDVRALAKVRLAAIGPA